MTDFEQVLIKKLKLQYSIEEVLGCWHYVLRYLDNIIIFQITLYFLYLSLYIENITHVNTYSCIYKSLTAT